MSWIGNLEGNADPNYRDEGPKVADPSIPNRMVSTKSANQPFLAYKQYREQQQQRHDAWLVRKKERDEKLARGEEAGPEEPDPTAERDIGLRELLRFLVLSLLVVLLAGKFVTGDFLWGYEGKWTNLKTYFPPTQRLFSERSLSLYDGTDPDRPIYLAIDGEVYDVSSNPRVYGPGGSYHIMAGKDAARAFGTGCFATHQTHDLRGLSESELRGVEHWKKFFKDHKTYHRIGHVNHPPIDPELPIPEHCNPKKAQSADPKKQTSEFAGPKQPDPAKAKAQKHEEL
ncbi:hypothetical protein EVG20_g7322 [Dentipellis fragilis]|uniref:Cytochrome b5 heme-binding domain-containing protein n=1 Tax=Dentipellis fragilis TaxID=205917 RepID=A0A4Y9YET7_9AGAM|nr:hypothetical protein EVG20_g7322 [Dentipellis fragilis]